MNAPLAQYARYIPPRALTLPELVDVAIATSNALSAATGLGNAITDHDYCRVDEAAFDARADLRAELMNLGLSKAQIDKLGEVL